MTVLQSAFRSARGEAEYMGAYESTLRFWPVPYEARDIDSRFGRTHVVVCGPEGAPPLVLLHCFFMSLTVWANNIASLSRDHRVYALDMMGQPGKSIPDLPILDRDDMAEWLTATLDGLGIARTDLIGWSYGGFAAINYALHRPDRLRKLVLLTPIGSFVPLKTQFFIRGLLTRLPGRVWSNSMMRWFTYGPALRDRATRSFFAAVTDQFYPGTRHFRVPPTVLPVPYTDEELGAVTCPTLLLIGQQEALYDPVAALMRAKQLLLDLTADLIPEAGHELPGSKPEAVNSRVLEFLGETSL